MGFFFKSSSLEVSPNAIRSQLYACWVNSCTKRLNFVPSVPNKRKQICGSVSQRKMRQFCILVKAGWRWLLCALCLKVAHTHNQTKPTHCTLIRLNSKHTPSRAALCEPAVMRCSLTLWLAPLSLQDQYSPDQHHAVWVSHQPASQSTHSLCWVHLLGHDCCFYAPT